MTALQLATLHCSNHNQDGSCLGAVIKDDLHIRVCRPKPKCCVGTPGVRCEHFEQCLLPMNSGDWPQLKTPKQHQAFAEAVHDYQRAANVRSAKERICVCGRELEPRRRMCYQCRQEARRKTYSAHNQNGRVGVPQLTQKSSLQAA
jgi:hypothetical protein